MGLNLKDFINGFVDTTKTYIKKLEELNTLSNEDKKRRLDEILMTYSLTALDNLGLNFVFKLVIKKLLIANIPNFTQAIFNMIKLRIEGITK